MGAAIENNLFDPTKSAQSIYDRLTREGYTVSLPDIQSHVDMLSESAKFTHFIEPVAYLDIRDRLTNGNTQSPTTEHF